MKDRSALFRHDVAFCLGQRQDPLAIDVLKKTLLNTSEHPMCVAPTVEGSFCSRLRVWPAHWQARANGIR